MPMLVRMIEGHHQIEDHQLSRTAWAGTLAIELQESIVRALVDSHLVVAAIDDHAAITG